MLIEADCFDRIFIGFTDFVLLNRSYLLKGASNLLDLSSYSTYQEFDLSGVCSAHKAYQSKRKLENILVRRSLT